MNFYVYLLVAVLVTFTLRALPMFLIRKPLKNRFLRSFLYYVPYVTISVMLFPEILYQTSSLWAGIAVTVVGIVIAWFSSNLFLTASGVCIVSLILEWIFSK